MSRRIDRLPTPTHVEPKKLIVLSAPRTGTHGLYLALKRLGFKPYHMAEIIKSGPDALQILNDGLKAEMFHEGTPYGRAEFDKWFADYDIIIEMPFFMLRSTLKAYPDAKFLLTERNPDKWAKSFENTIGMMCTKLMSFPMSVFKYFDGFSYGMADMGGMVLNYYTNGYGLTPEGHKHLMENYSNYIEEVKRLVPLEQLKVCKLEDGFGWNDICPYLDVPVPDEKWPSLNTPEEFGEIAKPKVKSAFRKGMFGTTSILAPIIAAGVWYLRSKKLSL
ncbi:P-loop containing nucleoside triphosphate hydrolase protein [Daldinia eschscholtzii]|nr:P-loop containing nucleoside triphosphate hydrolase protein [Daldinia eschscholtzii]